MDRESEREIVVNVIVTVQCSAVLAKYQSIEMLSSGRLVQCIQCKVFQTGAGLVTAF